MAIGLDGYTTAQWQLFLNLLSRELGVLGIGLETIDGNAATFISDEEINAMIDSMLEWDTKKDPTLLSAESTEEAIRECWMRTR